MKRALIKNGKIVSYSDITTAGSLTEHRYANVIEADKPAYDSKTHRLDKVVDISDDVNISWVKVALSSATIERSRKQGIKSFAERRILTVMSEINQRNHLARMFQLVSKGGLSGEETTELSNLSKKWDHARAVRAYSNTMEQDAAKPYAEDGTWPELN